jgi:hypothetical protein
MTYTKDDLPKGGWVEYRKKVTTRMVRMNGPFSVETMHGAVSCLDGFLAVDEAGYPYPIDAEEHARTYEQASTKTIRNY